MHSSEPVISTLFIVYSGAALLSTLALFTRQSLLVAYMLLGAILGPWGLKLVADTAMIKQSGDIGIIFLLFLLGLHLQPQNLWHMLRKTTWVAVVSSIIFAAVSYWITLSFGYSHEDSIIVGLAMMFSSTIIGLKLLPTTILHHQHTGEIMISVLLLQDVIAIITMLLLHGANTGNLSWAQVGVISISLPTLLLLAFLVQKFVLIKLFERFDLIREYVFLLSIGWCLSMAELAGVMGLSGEIGAFIAGVALASHPISQYIAESLKPLRDFFLVLFFFFIGASFNFQYLHVVIVPAIILAVAMMLLKPLVFRVLLYQVSETKKVAWEVGIRLGQVSEFSLLIVYLAENMKLVSDNVSFLVQAATMITFIASSYIVVLLYPTPMAFANNLRRD